MPPQSPRRPEGRGDVTAVMAAADVQWLLELTKYGKCLDLSGGSSSNGTQIQIWTCDSTNTNQNFALKQL